MSYRTDTKSRKRNKIFKDRFSELPDDILTFTLSFMPIKEASRTSILSSRWRYLWKDSVKFSSSLTLDAISMRGSGYSSTTLESRKLMAVERYKFIKWVNQILQLEYGSLLKTFRLQFGMNTRYSRHIDEWIRLSIAKRIQNFDIDLSVKGDESGYMDHLFYTIPDNLFCKEAGAFVKCIHLKSCNLRTLDFKCFESLVDLKLDNGLLEQNILTKFLTECPNLERLWLVGCYDFSSITISGSSLKLKEVKIVSLEYLSDIKIDAKNLNKFEYWGPPTNFSFENVPVLSHLSLACNEKNGSVLRYVLGQLSSDIPKLETFSLIVSQIEVFLENRVSCLLPSYRNLRKLIVNINAIDQSLWGLVPLLWATPFLRALELHLFCSNLNQNSNLGVGERPSDSPHLHLMEIMLTGFFASEHELEFIGYLFENCEALQTMILDTTSKYYDPYNGISDCMFSTNFYKKMKKKMHRQVQKFLMPVVPSGVKVMVL